MNFWDLNGELIISIGDIEEPFLTSDDKVIDNGHYKLIRFSLKPGERILGVKLLCNLLIEIHFYL